MSSQTYSLSNDEVKVLKFIISHPMISFTQIDNEMPWYWLKSRISSIINSLIKKEMIKSKRRISGMRFGMDTYENLWSVTIKGEKDFAKNKLM